MINPNAGFMDILLRYETVLGMGSSTATSPASGRVVAGGFDDINFVDEEE